MKLFSFVLLFLSMATTLPAGVIFSEDFSGSTNTGYIATAGALVGTSFTLVSGSVDINTPTYYSALCASPASGYCLDTTGGGTGGRGTVTTASAISLAAGSYTLSFDLVGWSYNDPDAGLLNQTATIRVTLGSLIDQIYTVTGGTSPTTAVLSFTVSSDTTAYLTFADLEGTAAYAGAILDNIDISTASDAVPEPGSLLMVAGGALALFVSRRRR